MRHDLTGILKPWRVASGMSQTEVAKALGCSTVAISQYETVRCRVSAEYVAQLAVLFGVDVEKFLAGPVAPKSATDGDADIDNLHECQALRIKRAVCSGCPAHPRGCPDCKLARYVALCVGVVNGDITLDVALRRAGTMAEDCIASANEKHDGRGFMSCGHVGVDEVCPY